MRKVSTSLAGCDDGGAVSRGAQAAPEARKARRQIPPPAPPEETAAP